MCAWFGCRELSGKDYHCPEHAAAHAARVREYRRKRKEALSAEGT
jgi:hypothetical protein